MKKFPLLPTLKKIKPEWKFLIFFLFDYMCIFIYFLKIYGLTLTKLFVQLHIWFFYSFDILCMFILYFLFEIFVEINWNYQILNKLILVNTVWCNQMEHFLRKCVFTKYEIYEFLGIDILWESMLFCSSGFCGLFTISSLCSNKYEKLMMIIHTDGLGNSLWCNQIGTVFKNCHFSWAYNKWTTRLDMFDHGFHIPFGAQNSVMTTQKFGNDDIKF